MGLGRVAKKKKKKKKTDPEAKRRELPFFVLSPVCGSVTVSNGA